MRAGGGEICYNWSVVEGRDAGAGFRRLAVVVFSSTAGMTQFGAYLILAGQNTAIALQLWLSQPATGHAQDRSRRTWFVRKVCTTARAFARMC